jgi:hypothetical protein
VIDGVTVKMGDKEYVVPPLNLKAVRRLNPLVEQMKDQSLTSYQFLPMVAEIALAAISRNYPDMTMEQLEDILDMGNARAVMSAVLGQSGFVPAGETAAVSATSP